MNKLQGEQITSGQPYWQKNEQQAFVKWFGTSTVQLYSCFEGLFRLNASLFTLKFDSFS